MLDTWMVEAELEETLRENPPAVITLLGWYLDDPFTKPTATRFAEKHNAILAAICEAQQIKARGSKLLTPKEWDDFL